LQAGSVRYIADARDGVPPNRAGATRLQIDAVTQDLTIFNVQEEWELWEIWGLCAWRRQARRMFNGEGIPQLVIRNSSFVIDLSVVFSFYY